MKDRLSKLLVFVVLAVSSSLCIAQGVDESKKPDAIEAASQIKSCAYYRTKLVSYIRNDGSFARNEIWPTVPYIKASFKQKQSESATGVWTGAWMRIADINGDFEYELLYLVDIATPVHDESKMYFVRALPKEMALSLIKDDIINPFWHPLMEYLSNNIEWGPYKAVKSGAVEIALSEPVAKLKDADDRWRFTFVSLNDGVVLLLIEGLETNKLWLAEFDKKFEQRIICTFDDLIK